MSRVKPYTEYKDSGVEWLGKVPAHWSLLSLKRAVDGCVNGVWGDESDGSNDIAVIRVADFDRQRLRVGLDKLTYRNVPANDRYSRALECGDLLIEKSGGGEKTLVGCVVLFDHEFPSVTSNFVGRMRPKAGFDSGFLCYAFNTLYDAKANITAIKQTTGIQNLDAEAYLQSPYCFPSYQEQFQIARYLDYETAKIDALIAEQQQLIELLQEKRQAVISNAVTKGLNPDAPMKDSGVEWIGGVPAHWEVGSLRWYATIQGGIAKGKDNQGLATVEMPYLRVANVQDGYVDLSEVKTIDVLPNEVERYLLQAGDVLMNEGGDNDKLGRGCVWSGEINPCLHQNHVFAIRTKSIISPEWLAIFTRGSAARAYFQTSAKQSTNLASISASNIMGLPIVIPPPSEQTAILSQLESINSRIDVLSSSARSASQFFQERRSALISAAVAGKIDVRDWQPPEGDSVELNVDTEVA